MPSNAVTDALRSLVDGRDLTTEESAAAVAEIMEGAVPEALMAAWLTALRCKGETAEELAGAVRAIWERMEPLEVPGACRPILDTCGTGGDRSESVNVSTATALIVAACGVRVAKHGNRSATGNSGSAEVLAELGVEVEAPPAIVRRCLEDVGIAFLFAPRFHPALRHAGPVRRALPFRTLFNLVGPLVNPAGPDHQLLGVPDAAAADLIARAAFVEAGAGMPGRLLVVNGSDGLDEVTLAGPTQVRWAEGGTVSFESWHPSDFGLGVVATSRLRIAGPADSADRIRRLLEGERGPIRDVVLANVAAALRLAGVVGSLVEGVARGAEAIDSGAAGRLLRRWAEVSRSAP